jgi:hypothetical protein
MFNGEKTEAVRKRIHYLTTPVLLSATRSQHSATGNKIAAAILS